MTGYRTPVIVCPCPSQRSLSCFLMGVMRRVDWEGVPVLMCDGVYSLFNCFAVQFFEIGGCEANDFWGIVWICKCSLSISKSISKAVFCWGLGPWGAVCKKQMIPNDQMQLLSVFTWYWSCTSRDRHNNANWSGTPRKQAGWSGCEAGTLLMFLDRFHVLNNDTIEKACARPWTLMSVSLKSFSN